MRKKKALAVDATVVRLTRICLTRKPKSLNGEAVSAISVIIPTYNRKHFISEAVQSVLHQTCPPSEIIVVDDGSTDGTEEVVSKIAAPIPIVYVRQRNQGPGAARNFGASIARGDWISFLDDDDVWCPNKLAVQSNYMMGHPEVALVYAHVEHTDEGGRPIPKAERGDEFSTIIFGSNPPAFPSTVLVKKDVFLQVGGFGVQLRHAEDWDLFARIARQFAVHCLAEKLVRYRWHKNQFHEDPRLIHESWSLFHDSLYRLWKDDPLKQAVLFRKSAQVYSSVAKQYLIMGDFQQSRKHYKKAFIYRPWSAKVLRRWALSYLPFIRDWYRHRKMKRRGSID